jgi:hypothetical protein
MVNNNGEFIWEEPVAEDRGVIRKSVETIPAEPPSESSSSWRNPKTEAQWKEWELHKKQEIAGQFMAEKEAEEARWRADIKKDEKPFHGTRRFSNDENDNVFQEITSPEGVTAKKLIGKEKIPKKPSDSDLDSFEEWIAFKKKAKEKIPELIGINPNAIYEETIKERRSKRDNVDKSLLSPEERTKKEYEDEQIAQAKKKEAEDKIDAYAEGLRPMFDKQVAAQQEAKKAAPQATEWGLRERAANGDLTAIAALTKHVGEKKAEDDLKREISDKDLYKPLINNLPKAKDEAIQADIRVKKYQHLLSMAERGEGGGLVSGLKGMLAPVSEAMGIDSDTVKEMSEAQVFQLMARSAVGSQRLMLVGSGQVSNYEQQLMQKLSGGSIKVSREAAKELFKFYINESQGLTNAYNMQIDNLSEKFPDVKKMYGYAGKNESGQQSGKEKTIKSGEIMKGYKFKGGNPADKNNWEKVK